MYSQPLAVCLDVHRDDHHFLHYLEQSDRMVAAMERPETKIAQRFDSNKTHAKARRVLNSEYSINLTSNRARKNWNSTTTFKMYRKTCHWTTVVAQEYLWARILAVTLSIYIPLSVIVLA